MRWWSAVTMTRCRSSASRVERWSAGCPVRTGSSRPVGAGRWRRRRSALQTKPEPRTRAEDLVVDIHDLSVHFDLGGSTLARLLGQSTGTVRAVDGVHLQVRKGEVVG